MRIGRARRLRHESVACAVAVSVLACLAAAPARAQTDQDRAAARLAATQGVKAMQEGRYKDALSLCTRAESLMHAPTHLLLMARADEKLGQLVEAQEAYIKIQRDKLPANAPRAFVEAQANAAEELAALAPRVPTLKVDYAGDGAGDVEVTLDGQPYPSALVGMASPVDPGVHRLEAKSATATAEPVTVTVAEGAKATAVLTFHAIAVAKPAAIVAEPAPGGPAKDKPSSGSALRVAGWVAVGVGVAGLAAGTFFVAKNHSDRDDADALCGAMGCPDSRRSQITSLDNSANSDAMLSWISYGVGAAAVAGGVTMIILGRGKPASQQQTGRGQSTQAIQVLPWFAGTSAGVRVAF